MRTASRLAVTAAVMGGGLLLGAPASAQEACPYPADPRDCISGGEGQPASGDGGGSTVENNAGRSAGGAGSLPFTGGEVTLIALAGTAAVGGGVVLVAAGRKRATV